MFTTWINLVWAKDLLTVFAVTEKVWETSEVMDVSEEKVLKPPVQKPAAAAAAQPSAVSEQQGYQCYIIRNVYYELKFLLSTGS